MEKLNVGLAHPCSRFFASQVGLYPPWVQRQEDKSFVLEPAIRSVQWIQRIAKKEKQYSMWNFAFAMVTAALVAEYDEKCR